MLDACMRRIDVAAQETDRNSRVPDDAGPTKSYVFCTTMFGNLVEKSSAFCATKMATLRAIALYAVAAAPSGSAMTDGRPESACSRIRMSSGRLPRNGTL